MKAKRILCFVLVVLLCFSLCGCRVDLDDLRERIAYIQPDGQTLVLNGAEYRLIDGEITEAVDVSYGKAIYVCPPDVPLLAAETSGIEVYRSYDGVFLKSYYGDEAYYCRSDRYEEVKQVLETAPADHTKYWCLYSDSEYNNKAFLLTKEQTASLDAAFAAGEFSLQDGDHSKWYEKEYDVSLWPCDDTGWVSYGEALTVAWDVEQNSGCDYMIVDDNQFYDTYMLIPEEYAKELDSIFAPVVEANEIDYTLW